MGACHAIPKDAGEPWPSAIDTPWQLSRIDGDAADPAFENTLTLAADGRVAGQTGRDRFFGTYEQSDDGQIRFHALGVSRLKLDPSAQDADQSSPLLGVLGQVDRYHLQPQRLLLYDSDRLRLEYRLPDAQADQ